MAPQHKKNGHLCGAAKDVLRLFQDLKDVSTVLFKMFQDEKEQKKMRVQTHLFSMETRVNSRKNNVLYIYSCDLSFCVYETKRYVLQRIFFPKVFFIPKTWRRFGMHVKNIK
jgi:protein-arginine kinase